MEENIYIYETQKRAYGRGEYQVRRRAKKVTCLTCRIEWIIRRDRNTPLYCKECGLKGDKNPMFGKIPHNKGKINFDDKAYKRNYYNELRHTLKKELIKLFGNECSFCKQKNLPLCVWHFHHLEKGNKIKAISQMLILTKKRLIEELEKCVMVCANCHLIIHRGDERLQPINGVSQEN